MILFHHFQFTFAPLHFTLNQTTYVPRPIFLPRCSIPAFHLLRFLETPVNLLVWCAALFGACPWTNKKGDGGADDDSSSAGGANGANGAGGADDADDADDDGGADDDDGLDVDGSCSVQVGPPWLAPSALPRM